MGEVISKTLSRDGKRIFLTARIRDAHSNLVKSNSVFWEAATVEAKVGIFKVEIDTPSVTAPAGRVAFHTPDGGGGPVKAGTVFTLLTKPQSATPVPKAKSAGAISSWFSVTGAAIRQACGRKRSCLLTTQTVAGA
ncbi:MAG: hypothetical protein NTW21_26900 [Verrucomicrobia bacterium]|nr:hypothetical protein [Verrucomicrobiota bacterium]